MSNGFYLMHRGWMDDPLFIGEPFTRAQAWEWLIHEATFEPHKIKHPSKMQMIEVQRGQIATSYRKLKEKFQWGNERVRRFIDVLVSEQMVSTHTGTGFLVITICNYDKFQRPFEKAGTHLGTQTGTESGTHLGTPIYIDKKESKIREKKIKTPPKPTFKIPDWIPEKEWNDYLEMRKAKRTPNTEGAKTEAVAELDKLRQQGYPPDEVLRQSILRGWTGVFKLKKEITFGSKSFQEQEEEKIKNVLKQMDGRYAN